MLFDRDFYFFGMEEEFEKVERFCHALLRSNRKGGDEKWNGNAGVSKWWKCSD
jgi:hypothetical protein